MIAVLLWKLLHCITVDVLAFPFTFPSVSSSTRHYFLAREGWATDGLLRNSRTHRAACCLRSEGDRGFALPETEETFRHLLLW